MLDLELADVGDVEEVGQFERGDGWEVGTAAPEGACVVVVIEAQESGCWIGR